MMKNILALGLSLGLAATVQADPAAYLLATEGTVFVTRAATGKKVIVSQGSALEGGDTVQTERESTARVRFTDGAELALRPNSNLQIQNYVFNEQKPEQDSLILRLFKGGLRQISGAIAHRGNPDAYRLHSPTATIGIRGTDFTARLCDGDCAESAPARAGKPVNNNPRPVAARIASLQGQLHAAEATGNQRALTVGSPVYPDDILEKDRAGAATLVFSDSTRMVLDAGGQFHLAHYRYAESQPALDNFGIRLLKGGFRLLTGLIGKRQAQRVGITAGTATIGIRGTNFDVVCVGGGDAPADAAASVGVVCDQALYAHTREGAISLQSGDGAPLVLAAGQTGHVTRPGAQPVLTREAPSFLQDKAWPQPEATPFDPEQFGTDGANTNEPGLYVLVREGRIAMAQDNRQLVLDAGEAAYASSSGKILQRFSNPPASLEKDRFMSDRLFGFGTCRR